MKNSYSLTEGSIGGGLIRFTIPMLFTGVLQSLNATVNPIWVGRYLGEAALAATLSAQTVIFVLIAAALGIASATTVMIGRYVGAGDIREAKRTVGTSLTFFGAASACFGIAGLILSGPLLTAIKTPAESIPLALSYMRVMFVALPCLYTYVLINSIMAGAGDSKTPLYFNLLAVGVEIGLNPILIFGIGPIPRLGVAGAAVAMLVSQAVSIAATIYYLYGRRHALCLYKDELALLRVDWTIVRALLRMGVPLGAQVLLLSLSEVLMITLANRFGVECAAAWTAAIQLWTFVLIPVGVVGTAASAMAAQNVGARKWDRVSSIARLGVLYAVVLTGAMIVALEILDNQAFRLYLPPNSPALIVATRINHIGTWSYAFFAISGVLFGVVRATGAVVAPLLILAAELVLVRLPISVALLDWQKDNAIWLSFLVSSIFEAALAALYYKYGSWRMALGERAAASVNLDCELP